MQGQHKDIFLGLMLVNFVKGSKRRHSIHRTTVGYILQD